MLPYTIAFARPGKPGQFVKWLTVLGVIGFCLAGRGLVADAAPEDRAYLAPPPGNSGADPLSTLPRGRLLEVAGQGHGLLGVGCMPRLVADFIRTLDARGLDARCLEVLAQAPPFLDANGAGP